MRFPASMPIGQMAMQGAKRPSSATGPIVPPAQPGEGLPISVRSSPDGPTGWPVPLRKWSSSGRANSRRC